MRVIFYIGFDGEGEVCASIKFRSLVQIVRLWTLDVTMSWGGNMHDI
jgi:hypothetical protein